MKRALLRMGLTTVLAFAVSGCGTIISSNAPSCDGYSRRPLNRSLWDWEGRKVMAGPQAAPAETPRVPVESKPLVRKAESAKPAAEPSRVQTASEPTPPPSLRPSIAPPPATGSTIPAAPEAVPAFLRTMPGSVAPVPMDTMRRSKIPLNVNVAASHQACTVS